MSAPPLTRSDRSIPRTNEAAARTSPTTSADPKTVSASRSGLRPKFRIAYSQGNHFI